MLGKGEEPGQDLGATGKSTRHGSRAHAWIVLGRSRSRIWGVVGIPRTRREPNERTCCVRWRRQRSGGTVKPGVDAHTTYIWISRDFDE
jgi:hypothetical protein